MHGDPTTSVSGPTFTEEDYQRTKHHFAAAWEAAKAADQSLEDFFRVMISRARESYPAEWIRNSLAPMLRRFVAEQRAIEAGAAESELAPAAEPAPAPAGFTEEDYQRAKPHFAMEWAATKEAGGSIGDFVRATPASLQRAFGAGWIQHKAAAAAMVRRFAIEQREAERAEIKPQQTEDGLHGTVPASDAGAGAADVQEPVPERPDRGASATEGAGSAGDVRGVDGGRAEAQERLPGAAVGEPSGGTGVRDADGVSVAGSADDVAGENFRIEPGALHEARGRAQKAREIVAAKPVEAHSIEAEERIELTPTIRLNHRVGRLMKSRTMAVVWLLAMVLVALPISYERLVVLIGPIIVEAIGNALVVTAGFFLILVLIATGRWLYDKSPALAFCVGGLLLLMAAAMSQT